MAAGSLAGSLSGGGGGGGPGSLSNSLAGSLSVPPKDADQNPAWAMTPNEDVLTLSQRGSDRASSGKKQKEDRDQLVFRVQTPDSRDHPLGWGSST